MLVGEQADALYVHIVQKQNIMQKSGFRWSTSQIRNLKNITIFSTMAECIQNFRENNTDALEISKRLNWP